MLELIKWVIRIAIISEGSGIPQRKGANRKAGAPTYRFAQFSQNNYIKYKKLGPGNVIGTHWI